jgi:hypothetical protein
MYFRYCEYKCQVFVICEYLQNYNIDSLQAERREAVDEFVDECMRRFVPDEYSEREKAAAAELMELAGEGTKL